MANLDSLKWRFLAILLVAFSFPKQIWALKPNLSDSSHLNSECQSSDVVSALKTEVKALAAKENDRVLTNLRTQFMSKMRTRGLDLKAEDVEIPGNFRLNFKHQENFSENEQWLVYEAHFPMLRFRLETTQKWVELLSDSLTLNFFITMPQRATAQVDDSGNLVKKECRFSVSVPSVGYYQKESSDLFFFFSSDTKRVITLKIFGD